MHSAAGEGAGMDYEISCNQGVRAASIWVLEVLLQASAHEGTAQPGLLGGCW